jgi:hypothetical protein
VPLGSVIAGWKKNPRLAEKNVPAVQTRALYRQGIAIDVAGNWREML